MNLKVLQRLIGSGRSCFLRRELLSNLRVVVQFEFDHHGRRMSAATVVVDQRDASAALATRSSLSARTIVQGNHTANNRILWNTPNHTWNGAPSGSTRSKHAAFGVAFRADGACTMPSDMCERRWAA